MEQRALLRARFVLMAAEGRSTRAIARELKTMPRTISGWRARFARADWGDWLTSRGRPLAYSNQIEIWFSILQGQSLRAASFDSVTRLREHSDAFIEAYDHDAAPFVWTKAEVHQRRFKGRRISEL
jgi:hypothetical protein